MSDIVETLRHIRSPFASLAAAEITRLRADLAAAQERERALLETIERVQAAGEEMRQRLAKHMATPEEPHSSV